MNWRDRIGNLFGRAASPATPAGGDGGGVTGVSSPPSLTSLPPWGNQWPMWASALSAENLSVVTACVDAIAGALASLPVTIFERLPDGTKTARPDHPIARIVAAPTPLHTWVDVVRFTMDSVLREGNALLEVVRDGNGQPVELWPVVWQSAQPQVLPSGRLCFDLTAPRIPWGAPVGLPRRLFADNGELFWLRARSSNGVFGVSPLARAAQVVALSLNAQSFADAAYRQGGRVGGIFKHPGRLGKEAADRISQSFRDTHGGPQRGSRVMVLEESMSFEPAGGTLEDAQLQAARELQSSELCRLFQVPPAIVGILDKSNFATSQQAAVFFGEHCLTPHATAWEQEASRSLFLNDRFGLELDLSGLLRGDFTTRAGTVINLLRAGCITQNEARRQLGFDPLPGADTLVMQSTGGRPQGTGDGEGDSLPGLPGGAQPNGTRPNGSASLQ